MEQRTRSRLLWCGECCRPGLRQLFGAVGGALPFEVVGTLTAAGTAIIKADKGCACLTYIGPKKVLDRLHIGFNTCSWHLDWCCSDFIHLGGLLLYFGHPVCLYFGQPFCPE